MASKEEVWTQAQAWSVKAVTQAHFDASAARVKTLDAMDDDQKLVLYGFFKQANAGDNNVARPWAIQIVECKKWDAWTLCKGMTKEQATLAYVYYVDFVVSDFGKTATY